LFDVYSPEEIVQFVRASMEKHGDTQRCCQVSPPPSYLPSKANVWFPFRPLTIALDS
jgi:hypothetical protein